MNDDLKVLIQEVKAQIAIERDALSTWKQYRRNVKQCSAGMSEARKAYLSSHVDSKIKQVHQSLSFLQRQYLKLRKRSVPITQKIDTIFPKVDFSGFLKQDLKLVDYILVEGLSQLECRNDGYLCRAISNVPSVKMTAEWPDVGNRFHQRSIGVKIRKQIDIALRNVRRELGNFRPMTNLLESYGLTAAMAIQHPQFKSAVLSELEWARKKHKAANIDIGDISYSDLIIIAHDFVKDHEKNTLKTCGTIQFSSIKLSNTRERRNEWPFRPAKIRLINTPRTDQWYVTDHDELSYNLRKIWVGEMRDEIKRLLAE